MKFMKALVLPLAFVSGTSLAASALFSVQDVNSKIEKLVQPFNNQTTKLELAFTKLNIDAVKTLDFGFTGLVSKVGSENEAKVEFKKAEYAYGDGSKPVVNLDVALTLDLVKAFGQDTINSIAGDLDEMVLDMSKDYTKEYGAALTLNATTAEKILDAQGNVESMKVVLDATMDMAQLPSTKPVEEVEFQTLHVEVLAAKTGFSIQATVVINPLYKGFARDQDGMKEYVEKLLADDQQTWDDLSRYLAILDSVAAWLVEMKP